jgi:hypothetical protein
MHRDLPLHDAGGKSGFSEGALHKAYGHGILGGSPFVVPFAESRKDQAWIPVGVPIAAQQVVTLFGERCIPFLGPFAVMDMDHHAVSVDVQHSQPNGLRDPESTGVDGRKTREVLNSFTKQSLAPL